jgi:D-proline reductase (dithiol) PrdB
MPKLERLSAVVRQVLTSFPCLEPDDTPWTPPSRELKHSSLALVTSAGLHLRHDKPFSGGVKGGDTSYRVIPSDAKTTDIVQSHTSIGFDHTGIYRDLNVTFPLDRMRELVARGVVGGLAPNAYSFMGALRDMSRIVDETGPQVAQKLRDEGAEVVFLTPT